MKIIMFLPNPFPALTSWKSVPVLPMNSGAFVSWFGYICESNNERIIIFSTILLSLVRRKKAREISQQVSNIHYNATM